MKKVIRGVHYSPAISAIYYKALRSLIEKVYKDFYKTVLSGLERPTMQEKVAEIVASRAESKVKDESANEAYKRLLTVFNKRFRRYLTDKAIRKLVKDTLERAGRYSGREIARRFQTLGLDLTKGENVIKKYASYMSATTEENILLVKNLAEEEAKRLQGIVLRGFREGIPTTKLGAEIQSALGVSKRRAVTIARTETHKIVQQLADYRARDVGITRGRWRAVMDNRTSEQHARFNGKEFDLKKGLYDRKTKTYNWPGRRVNCRCWTEYII